MAWTSSGEVLTAAKLNAGTAAGVATTAGGIFVATGTNTIAERVPATAYVATSETETNTSYDDMATAGPAVTVTTGTKAIVVITALLYNSGSNDSFMSFAISGSSSVAADSKFSLTNNGTSGIQASATYLVTGLTAGSNTFTAKYAVGAGTGTFARRHITVIPL